MRATAILLMVVFHFVWDLDHFGYINTDIPNGFLWKELRAFIVSLFLFSVGASLVFSFRGSISLNKLYLRLFKISVAASLVTLSSLVTMPNHWIYFGILHFIVIASALLVWLVEKPLLSLYLSLTIFVTYLVVELPLNWPFTYFDRYLPKHTVDLVTPIPWLALPLLGIWAAHLTLFRRTFVTQGNTSRYITVISKNSLIIYLLHQPLFFAGFIFVGYVDQI